MPVDEVLTVGSSTTDETVALTVGAVAALPPKPRIWRFPILQFLSQIFPWARRILEKLTG